MFGTVITAILLTVQTENILIIGDSFAHRLEEGSGQPVYEELIDSGYTVRIAYRNTGTECGVDGGSLVHIQESLDCFDFEWADRVILMAGYHDRYYPQFGHADKSTRAERAESIRSEWEDSCKAGAEFHWIDTWEWAKRGLDEGFAVDEAGHISADGYEKIFDRLDI
jgi:hypothetical protein